MRTVTLKKLCLVNFKGIRHLDINFQDRETVICGENGTGKTTIFDAFLWLLFGKDSTGRSDSNFNIKTLDENGAPILRLEHSVTGILDVDGREIKLQRCCAEKWVKPRGTTEETLQNHQTEFYLNDVKLSTKKEFDAEVADIMPEDVFRMVTNPFYFPSLAAATQKDMLMDMAGEVSDQEVAALSQDYKDLLAELQGRPLATFLKEIAAKKKAIKDELLVIPSNIETARRLMPDAEDWVLLESSLNDLRKELADIDAQLTDISKKAEAESQNKVEIQKQIGAKKLEISRMENEIKSAMNKEYDDAVLAKNQAEHTLQMVKMDSEHKAEEIKRIQERIDAINTELTSLRAEFKAINAKQLQYPEGAFVCPTCKRPLEIEDVEAKQKELQANFNQAKAQELQANKSKGMAKKAELDDQTAKLAQANTVLRIIKENVASAQEKLDAMIKSMPKSVDPSEHLTAIQKDQRYIDLRNEITDLENQLTEEYHPIDNSKLLSRKSELNTAIQDIITRQAKKSQIERASKEIETLEEKRINANQAMADLEKIEFVAFSFQKAKDDELLKRINGLFQIVSFSFVSAQLNGGEKLTCVCTVNGTPYPDVNNAGKINAGLDIINAICKSKGISAPIFIDNRESVNTLIPTLSQVINLCVSKDPSLVIQTGNNQYVELK